MPAMRRPWAGAVTFRRGWTRRLGAFAALLGFLFTATTPGLALVTSAGGAVAVTGMLDVYVCHAKDGGRAVPAGEEPAADGQCCLICQASQLAHGAVPPAGMGLADLPGAVIREPMTAGGGYDAAARRHAQARAPPFA